MNATIQLEPISSAESVTVAANQHPANPAVAKAVVDSVLQYVRAVRRLGRTRVSTTDIADALDIAPAKVRAAVRVLQSQGVKLQ